MRYAPPPHVRLANVDGDLVVFDLRHDEYLAVPRNSAAAAVCALSGQQHDRSDPVLLELLEDGFLTRADGGWRPDAACPACPLPEPRPKAERFSLRLVLAFMIAVATTFVAYQRGQAPRALRFRSSESLHSPQEMASIIAQFEQMRVLVPHSGRCLIQSMLLIRFLGWLGIRSELVFGVRTHPFEAHCWVEWESHILNDSPDHASWFTGIARF